jgi:hypothetical protein
VGIVLLPQKIYERQNLAKDDLPRTYSAAPTTDPTGHTGHPGGKGLYECMAFLKSNDRVAEAIEEPMADATTSTRKDQHPCLTNDSGDWTGT